MIVIDTDTHKRSHALAAVDEATGKVRGKRQIQANRDGHLAAVRWARSLDEERVWAIEDCRHVSRRLEQALLAVGERVIRVAPHRMGASRKGERAPGKSEHSWRPPQSGPGPLYREIVIHTKSLHPCQYGMSHNQVT